MRSVTITDPNAQRAEEQYHDYQFRKVTIAGQTGVFVTAPAVRGTHAIYTVDVARRSCNCKQHRERCKGTAFRCKHVHMAERYLRETAAPQLPAPVIAASRPMLTPERRAQVAAWMAQDFPAD